MSSCNPPPDLKAEALARLSGETLFDAPSSSVDELVQALRLHQLELEMQNETLRQTQAALEQSRDRYLDLYEFAPLAYLTLASDGLISESNFTAARLLGMAREALWNRRFSVLVSNDDRERWERHCLDMKNGNDNGSIELALQRVDGSIIQARIDCSADGATDLRNASADQYGSRATPGMRLAITDISERQRIENALRKKEHYQRALLDNFPFAVWLKDTEGNYLSVNLELARILGADNANALVGKNDFDLVAYDMAEGFRADDRALLASREKMSREEELLSEGKRQWFETYKAPVVGDNDEVIGTVGFARNIDARRQADIKLQLAASVFTHARESIMITAADGTIIDVNDTFSRLTGYSRHEAIGQNLRFLESGRHDQAFYSALWRELTENGHWYGEIWNRRKNGEIYAEMLTISAVRDAEGRSLQYVALSLDITLLKAHEKQLEHLAHYDALTSLPNRVLFADRLHQAMTQALRRERPLALAYLDIDGFKAINDCHGHDVGDQLLIAVTDRMKQVMREGDTLARLGGDEFVSVLPDVADVAASVPVLNRLLAAAAQPVSIGDLVLHVSASLGVTFYPQAAEIDAEQLLRQADQAMYRAKQRGRNRYHVFDSESDGRVRSHHQSLERIRLAFDSGEFVLHYQPKVSLRTGRVIGAEALVRWQHPEIGLLLPAVFLPVIDDHQLAVELGEWVIDSALSQIECWKSAGLDFPLSVNMGSRQLQQSGFVDRLRALLCAHPGVCPGDLELEVLESSALEDLPRVAQVIESCRELGVLFAIDDFGTGYSSLTYLKRLSVAKVKIDQNLVRGMLDDPDDLSILLAVFGLATAFRRQVVAEGVETVEHGEMLLHLGFELAQGYAIARPMPAADVPGWVGVWRLDPAWADHSAVSKEDLPLLFASVEHRAWIVAFEAFLMGERRGPPGDIHLCRFGSWLDAQGLHRYGTHPALARVDDVHRQVHALATELLQLHSLGQNAEALSRIPELLGLRDELLGQLKALMRKNNVVTPASPE
jgi:diguanylate cyclase (GGDEF)-like protein/PAS domain S-box-containing protein